MQGRWFPGAPKPTESPVVFVRAKPVKGFKRDVSNHSLKLLKTIPTWKSEDGISCKKSGKTDSDPGYDYFILLSVFMCGVNFVK